MPPLSRHASAAIPRHAAASHTAGKAAPTLEVEPTEVGVIVNPHTRLLRTTPGTIDALRELLPTSCPIVTTERADDARAAVADFLEHGIKLIAVAGGDGTLASLVTALFGLTASDPHAAPAPAFLTLRAGTWNRVARALDLGGSPTRILRRALRDIRRGRLRVREQPTLRVASTLEPGPEYGFTALFGGLYELVEDAQRRGAARRHLAQAAVQAARQTLRAASADPDTAARERSTRLAANIDGVATVIGLAHATTLDTRVTAGGGFTLSTGHGTALGELRSLAATAFLEYVPGGSPARRVIFDIERGGFVLDGDLYPASTPYAVRVDVGPAARLAVV